MPGVYAIVNLVSDTVYVGGTVKPFSKRWSAHRSNLKRGEHVNPHLQRAWNKYGEKTFCFEILEETDPGDTFTCEQKWLDLFRKQGEVYNIGLVAHPPRLGLTHSEETKRKIGEAQKGRKFSEETRRKISEANRGLGRGRRLSEEHRQNISRSLMGRKRSKEFKRKMSVISKSRKHSEETRRKISEAKRGRKLSEEHKQKLRKPMSEEGKLKRAKPYPALYNKKTGEIISPGMNRRKLCRERGWYSGSLSSLINGARGRIGDWVLEENNPWNKKPVPIDFGGEIGIIEVYQLHLLETEDA